MGVSQGAERARPANLEVKTADTCLLGIAAAHENIPAGIRDNKAGWDRLLQKGGNETCPLRAVRCE